MNPFPPFPMPAQPIKDKRNEKTYPSDVPDSPFVGR